MATSVATPALDWLLGRVRELEPLIREHAPRAERERRLAPPVSDALRDAGFFRIFRPASRGDGLELDPITAFRVFEELSRIDSAVGWNVTLANACEVFGAWYSDRVTEEVFGSPETVMAGSWNPPRKAVPADGFAKIDGALLGWRGALTGRDQLTYGAGSRVAIDGSDHQGGRPQNAW